MKGVLCVDSEGDFQEMKISLRGLNISETALTENSEKILFVRDVDVVMTDYKMPGMGSVEPLRNLCVRGSEIPSMLFTDKGCGGGGRYTKQRHRPLPSRKRTANSVCRDDTYSKRYRSERVEEVEG